MHLDNYLEECVHMHNKLGMTWVVFGNAKTFIKCKQKI